MAPRQLLFLATLVLTTAQIVHAQQGSGKQFATRDPLVCTSKKMPATGAPSPEQIKQFLRCNVQTGERVSGNKLYLLDNITVEIGQGRPYHVSEMRIAEI